MQKITVRNYVPQAFNALIQHNFHPVLARIYAARGIVNPDQLETDLSRLIPYENLRNNSLMAAFLADAIAAEKRLLIIADYDSDGATACAVGIRALREFGAIVDYLVPNRFKYGYGLTPEIVQFAANNTAAYPDVLITVDNGIASVEGVSEANRLGMQVLITDHHLPGDVLPDAFFIINPNQPGCNFSSKSIAGVGVMFYLMLALRAELRKRGAFASTKREPNLSNLLDLVALGTVADVARLDDNNRILVQQGLQRIRKGKSCAGISALLQVAKRNFKQTSTYELGFLLGPRLNAAGRLDDMALGIECLITDDLYRAEQIALQLDALNRQRRVIEESMQDDALTMLEKITEKECLESETNAPLSLSLFNPNWHQGVIGILASRIKDKFHCPVIVFAPGNNDEIKGSGRSIHGFHLRDALDLVSKRHPGLLLKFGGHSAAAGLTISASNFSRFRDAFEEVTKALLTPADLMRVIETDGNLDESEINIELAKRLADQVWGQGFPYPTFQAHFYVENQRIVGDKHLKLKLRKQISDTENNKSNYIYDGMLFFYHTPPLPRIIDAIYQMKVNEYSGETKLQLILDHWTPAIQ